MLADLFRCLVCVRWIMVNPTCIISVTVTFTATIDVKRNIFDLCTDTKDCYLAVIEVRLHNPVKLQATHGIQP